jgi:hypothetical protein
MSANEKTNERFISIESIIDALSNHPEAQTLIKTIQPFIPLIIREGSVIYEDFISYAVEGKWTELDEAMWAKMTEDERDQLSDQILQEARVAVDNQYQRNLLARQMAFKVATSLLSVILL